MRASADRHVWPHDKAISPWKCIRLVPWPMAEARGALEETEPALGAKREDPKPCSESWQPKAPPPSSSLPLGGTNLDTKDILTRVAFEQGPLGCLALQQVGADGHLPTRHVGPKTFTDPPEGQVPTLGTAGTHTLEGGTGRDPRHLPQPQDQQTLGTIGVTTLLPPSPPHVGPTVVRGARYSLPPMSSWREGTRNSEALPFSLTFGASLLTTL